MFKHVRNWVSAAIVVLVAMPALAQPRITTSLDKPQQVIEGWGTAVGGNHQSLAWREAYRDLGMNILRVSMRKEVLVADPNDWTVPVELTDDMATNLQRMDIDAPQNLNAGRYTVGFERMDPAGSTAQWLAANAFEPERVKISGSPWTPPHWMKGPTGAEQDFVDVPGTTTPTPFFSDEVVPWRAGNPRSTGDSVGGRLKTEDPWTLDQYGKYIASWVAGWNQRYPEAPMDIISLQNESTFENPFDSMTLSVGPNGNTDFNQYALALKSVKDAWEQFQMQTRVMGPHHANFDTNPGNPWSLWRQFMMIKGVKNHADPELDDFLDFYNANYYNDTDEGAVKNIAAFYQGTDEVPGNWNRDFLNSVGPLARTGVDEDGKGVWFSETGENASGGWSNQINTALKIHNALVYGQASAYVYWQFASDSLGTHNLVANSQLDDPLQSKKYAAFKQYSGFIRPGAVRLEAGFDTADGAPAVGGNSDYDAENSLNVAAFLHEEDARLTFVLLNATDTSEQVTLAIPEGLEVPVMELFRTSGSESFTELGEFEFVDGELLYTAPAQSVSTFTGTVIPEPTGLALIGLGGVALLRRRR